MTYLPDDILIKVDRASMAVGLEARVPLLDHRVVELAWRLPLSLKVREGGGSGYSAGALRATCPRALVERPKMGFGVPIDTWLRGPLREWAEDLLDAERLGGGILRSGARSREMARASLRHRNWHYHLWDVLMFQAWLEAQG